MKPFLQVVTQKQEKDCAVAALAMLLDLGYEQTFEAFRGKVWKHGASNRQISNAARRLGFRVRWKPRATPDDTGLLFLEFDGRPETRHTVLIDEWRIFDTDGMVWDADQYGLTKHARFQELLTVEGKL